MGCGASDSPSCLNSPSAHIPSAEELVPGNANDGLESGPAGSSAHRLLLCGKEEKKHKLLDDFVIVF